MCIHCKCIDNFKTLGQTIILKVSLDLTTLSALFQLNYFSTDTFNSCSIQKLALPCLIHHDKTIVTSIHENVRKLVF